MPEDLADLSRLCQLEFRGPIVIKVQENTKSQGKDKDSCFKLCN